MTGPSQPGVLSFRYLVTGGGTGGHVYPGLALADQIREQEPGSEFLYVGARGGAEERIVPARGYALRTLKVRGLPSQRSPVRLVAVFLHLFRALIQAMGILIAYRPHAIIGTGGYASAPILLAALVLRATRLWDGTLAVHEQNIVPGRFNRWVHRWLDLIGTSFPETDRYFPGGKSCLTGYPLRREMQRESLTDSKKRREERTRLGIPEGAQVLLCFGGSTGARTLNRALLEALPRLLARQGLYVFHATGYRQGSYDPEAEARQAAERLSACGAPQNRYRTQPFYDHLETFYRAADLIVSRSGAGSVWEIASAARPAILIPKANLPGDHQVRNARFLERGAGTMARVLYEQKDPTDRSPRALETLDSGQFLEDTLSLLDAATHLPPTESPIPFPDGALNFYERLLQLRRGKADRRLDAEIEETQAGQSCPYPSRAPGIEWWTDLQLVSFLESKWKRQEEIPEADRRYVRYRADQLLAAGRWQQRNLGVKLVGLSRYRHRLPLLVRCIADRTPAPLLHRLIGGDFREVGFIRRNALQALWRLHEYDPEVRRALLLALTDPYFEVRSWAARAALLLADRIGPDPEFETLLRRNLRDRRFEVVVFSLEPLGKLSRDPGLLSDLFPLLEHKNWKIQEAAVRCLSNLVERKVIELTEEIDRELQRIPMKGQDFLPQFPLEKTWESFQRRRHNHAGDAHEPTP